LTIASSNLFPFRAVDNYVNAIPLLREHSNTGAVFAAGNGDIRKNAWDLASGEPEAKLLSAGQIAEMDREGIEFGAHSTNHRKLTEKPGRKVNPGRRHPETFLFGV
jgi:peptidoglycan/xylan/chitin deacetylase (PgdA/CDA1 family)